MYLAKNKHGEIGRKVPGSGFDAKIDRSAFGERRGNVYLSESQIENDQAYWDQVENSTRAIRQAEAVANKVKQIAETRRQMQRAQEVSAFQRLAKLDPMNEKLRQFYAKKAMMGETATAVSSLQLPSASADFSSSGANPQYVEGNPMTGGDQWRADFRQHMIVGNPLTRDGVYGPAVTDYDRFVQGVDVNQTDVVDAPIAGGTMLGRYGGESLPRGMGFSLSLDSITSGISNIVSQTGDNLVNALPDQLSKELQEQIFGGGQVTSSSGGVVNVTRQVPGTTTTYVQSQPLPQWAKWSLIGGGVLVGSLVLLSLVKSVKS
ncbi:MAG: hypothetical protein HC883_00215 [Bdellovibrionaceae bacterium]|nr:hypothetical protein [Pseudobdellovibrionaceae bacterium]